MPTTIPFTCYNSPNSQGETALPKPWPCCGWASPPASVSGTYRCISVPSFLCGTLPTTSTAFTLTLLSQCGSAYVYYNSALPFQFTTGVLGLCTEPTGTIVGSSIGTLGPGQSWVPDSGNGCSFVGGVHYLTFGGLLTQGNATLQILINQVTM